MPQGKNRLLTFQHYGGKYAVALKDDQRAGTRKVTRLP